MLNIKDLKLVLAYNIKLLQFILNIKVITTILNCYSIKLYKYKIATILN